LLDLFIVARSDEIPGFNVYDDPDSVVKRKVGDAKSASICGVESLAIGPSAAEFCSAAVSQMAVNPHPNHDILEEPPKNRRA